MAYESKAMLLREMEQKLLSQITAADLSKVLSVLSEQLENYDITYIATNTESDDLLDVYMSAMKVQGRSEKTLERYKYIIDKMMKAVGVSTRKVTVYHLRKYIAQEKERGLSDRTLESNRQVFSAYFNWLQREGLIKTNPIANLGVIKCKKQIKTTYSDIDFERMKYCCDNIRDRAIICFLMSTGCRISEMTQLDRNDVDLINLECNVVGKGNKERKVYLDQVTGMLLKEYFNSRNDLIPALFVGKGTERLTPQGVRKMLCNLEKKASVDHIHPHKFRRTLATNLIRHGMPIQEVAAILGHDKLDTTMKYVVLDNSDVKNSYRKYA